MSSPSSSPSPSPSPDGYAVFAKANKLVQAAEEAEATQNLLVAMNVTNKVDPKLAAKIQDKLDTAPSETSPHGMCLIFHKELRRHSSRREEILECIEQLV